MTFRTAILLAASVFTIHQFDGPALAQSNDESSQASTDYADDPSYQAAQRLLEVFAGAANERALEEERAQEDDLSTDPWPEAPKVDGWEHHYFIFQGENYFPILNAYVTPYVTLFSLQEGYTPVGQANKNCGRDITHQTVQEGAVSVTSSAAESALIGDAAGALSDARRYGCPNTVGELWGSGSQIMDKDHNPLAEQWFPDGTKAIIAGDFPRHDENRYEEDEISDFLVVFSGGPGRLGDPAIHPLPVEKMIVVDYPVLRREGGDDGGLKQEDGKPKNPYIPGASELPIGVFESDVVMSSGQALEDAPTHPDIEEISARIEAAIDRMTRERAADFLLVHRGDPNLSEQVAADRLRAIRETLQPHGQVKIASFGQELPICQTDDAHCWSVNRSTIVYLIHR